ncbi:MAG: sigma-54 dependent transcriptional regulator [Planctomycetota bacterium]
MPESLIVGIIDDDVTLRDTLVDFVRSKGHRAEVFTRGEELIAFLNEGGVVHVIITDLMLPGMSGLDLLKTLQADFYHIEVIFITGYATVDTAIEAIRRGARSYLEKPINSRRLEAELESAASVSRIFKDNIMLSRRLQEKKAFQRLLGASRAIEDVKKTISQVAPTDVTVLIMGESGTGKELVADAIQQISARANEHYLKVNLGALPKDLLESELFGHEKGAFTGAIEQRKGRFELADKGVIFLDEIGDLSLAGQVKLLRVLESGEFERVGGQRSLKVHVRVIAATNVELEKAVAEGRFREDLFYRLNVFRINVPPLRERTEDIPLIAFSYLQEINERYRLNKRITEEALQALRSYAWPGNVRELKNAIERAAIMSRGEAIGREDIPAEIMQKRVVPAAGPGAAAAGATMAAIEKQAILQALGQNGGNKKKTAEQLEIGLKTLYRKLAQYGPEGEIPPKIG